MWTSVVIALLALSLVSGCAAGPEGAVSTSGKYVIQKPPTLFWLFCCFCLAVGVCSSRSGGSTSLSAGHVKDEALLAGRDPSSFPAADEDSFHDMDGGVPLAKAEIEGRNTWLVWTAGNDRLWDTLIYRSAGALDFLKILSSHPALLKIDPRFSRDKRWEYLGLLNDPCFEKPTNDPDRWGLWLDHRRTDCKPIPRE